MKNTINYTIILIAFHTLGSCKKKTENMEVDYKQKVVGNWSGYWQKTKPQISPKYPCSIIFYDNNTGVLSDSAFGNPVPKFNHNFIVSSDSLIISFGNDTKWSLKLSNDYKSANGVYKGSGGSGIAVINKG